MPNTSTILDRTNIKQAKTAVQTYKDTCVELHTTLVNTITTLRTNGFIGDASDGFDTFFTTIEPALGVNLCGDTNSVTAMLDQLLTAVEKALMDTVDNDLKNANSKAASADSAATKVVNTGAVASDVVIENATIGAES